MHILSTRPVSGRPDTRVIRRDTILRLSGGCGIFNTGTASVQDA